MPGLDMERRTRVQARRDIAKGEARLGRQRQLIKRTLADGHASREALVRHNRLRDTPKTWREDRDEIIRTIACREAVPRKNDEPLALADHLSSV